MVQRTVSVGLVANVNNYVAGMAKAEAATRKTAAAAVGSEKQLRAQGEAFTKLGTLAMAGGAVAAAGLALVVKASAEFGSKMAQLQSLSHASAGDMKKLSDAAMSAGTAYGFSASQVADAEIEMTKAGVSVSAQLGGALKGALALAAAGQLDVGTATEYATVAMTQFGLSAKDVPHLADLMSAGADKALGSVGDLGEALKNGGLQAHNMGLTLDDTVGLLSAFANSGILGAEAGTQMRSMFIQLQRPTAQAQAMLDKYKITLYDSKGQFVGVTKLAGELATQLSSAKGVDQAARNAALATIFGSHAITGATVLYQDGAKGIQGWINKVNEAGFANAQAAGKLNSLTGDAQKLAAAFQTDLIKAGTGASGSLRGIVQAATGVTTAFGDLDPTLQNGVMAVGTLAAGVGLLGGAYLIAVPKIQAFTAAMDASGISGKAALGRFALLSTAIIGVTSLLSGAGASATPGIVNVDEVKKSTAAIQDHYKNVDKLFKGNFLQEGGLKAAFEAEQNGIAASNKGLDGLLFNATKAGDVYRHWEGQLTAFGTSMAAVSKVDYRSATASFNNLVAQIGGGSDKAKKLIGLLGPDYQRNLAGIARGIGVTASSTNLLAIASGKGAIGQRALAYETVQAQAAAEKQSMQLGKLTGSGNDATQSVKALHDALAGLGSTELDAHAAARAFQQAIHDATAALQKNGQTANKTATDIDINTQAGRDNQAALDTIASSARDSAAAYVKNGGSAKGAANIIADGRKKYIDTAHAMGVTAAGAAQKLADKMHLIPSVVKTAIDIENAQAAAAKIAAIKSALNNLDGTIANAEVNIRTSGGSAATAAIVGRQMQRLGYADGGAIGGPGPKGKDSVPAVLAPGEHVLTAGDVDKMGGQSGVYAFRAALHMATGGAVGDATRAVAAYKRAVSKAQSTYAHASKARKDDAKTRLDDARQHLADAQSRLTTLRQGREDFVSTQRRGPVDPLSYVDQLRSMSRDSNFSGGRRSSYYAAANKYEASLVKLSTKADAAATKLTDLKSASDQMRTSIASSIAGGYQASGAGSVAQASGWITRNGIRMQNYTSGVTGSSLASYYSGGAKSTAAFAGQLKALASRKVNPALIAEIAGYGVEQGAPIAAAILSASPSELATINSGYKAIQANAAAAGSTVANDNYAALITSQEKTTAALQKQLASDAERLRRLIAAAFGLKGYASGTTSATPGIHLVGERGPELLAFRGGERVYTAGQTAAYIRGTNQRAASSAPIRFEVSLPTSMNLIDAGGQIISTVRVEAAKVAKQVYSTETTAGAVHLLGSTR